MTNNDWQQRTCLLLGEQNIAKLRDANLLIVGLGGVGGYVVEALARLGVQNMTLVDGDVFCLSNLNRQILATQSTIGLPKSQVAKERVLQINPNAKVNAIHSYLKQENFANFDFNQFDVIVDAIDDVNTKVELAYLAQTLNKKIVSSMGSGNKLTPFFKVADVFKTINCPLARVMRKKLKERGVKKLTVVYSEELPVETNSTTVGSISYVPASCGLTIAYEVCRLLLN